jgi:choline dehydrogenase-like flavoprotein
VGDSLCLHPTIRVITRFESQVDAHLSRLPLVSVTEFMPEQRIGGSMFLSGLMGVSLAEDWQNRSHLLPDWRRCGLYYAMIRARGTGTIRNFGRAADPVVRYRLTDQDWRNLASALGRLARVMFAAGAKEVFPSITGHPGWTSYEQSTELVERGLPRKVTNLMSIHLFSSCPPGEDGRRCTTDSFGRLRGADNAIVADASQIPEAPATNPQSTVMAMAYRAAEAYVAGSDREQSRAAFHES